MFMSSLLASFLTLVSFQGNKQLKPDYVLGLTSGELYAYAVGNIYRNPSYRNFTHDEILQLLTKRGTRPSYANGSPVTETDLGRIKPGMSAQVYIDSQPDKPPAVTTMPLKQEELEPEEEENPFPLWQ